MLGSYEGAMADAAAGATGLPLGCRTLCGTCQQPIVVREMRVARRWVHEQRPATPHAATPVEQPELYRGERLVASVVESYERHRAADWAEQALARILAASLVGGRTDRDRLRAVWAVLAEVGYEPHRPDGGGPR